MTVLANERIEGSADFTDLWVAPHPNGQTYAYVGSFPDGLQIIDVTIPTVPVIVAQNVKLG